MMGRYDGHWYEYESDGALGLVVEQPDGHWDNPRTDADALVLAWGGEPVFQGYSLLDGHPDMMELEIDRVLRGRRKTLSFVEPNATLVLLDAEGREVTDAE